MRTVGGEVHAPAKLGLVEFEPELPDDASRPRHLTAMMELHPEVGSSVSHRGIGGGEIPQFFLIQGLRIGASNPGTERE